MIFDIFLLNLLKPFCLFADVDGSGDGGGDGDGGDTAVDSGDDSGDSDGGDKSGEDNKDDKGKKEGDSKEQGKKDESSDDKKLPEDFNQEKWDKLKEIDPEKWEKLKGIDLEKTQEATELLESISKDENLYKKVLKTIEDHKEAADPETHKRLEALEKEIGERKNSDAKVKFEAERDKISTELVKETSLKELSEFEKEYVDKYVVDQFRDKNLKIDQMEKVVKEAVERLEKNHKARLGKAVKKEGGPDPIKDGRSGKEKEGRDLTSSDKRVQDSVEYLQNRMQT